MLTSTNLRWRMWLKNYQLQENSVPTQATLKPKPGDPGKDMRESWYEYPMTYARTSKTLSVASEICLPKLLWQKGSNLSWAELANKVLHRKKRGSIQRRRRQGHKDFHDQILLRCTLGKSVPDPWGALKMICQISKPKSPPLRVLINLAIRAKAVSPLKRARVSWPMNLWSRSGQWRN